MSYPLFVLNLVLIIITVGAFGGTTMLSIHTGGYLLYPIVLGVLLIVQFITMIYYGVEE